jgi:hypothetical protein
MCNQKGQWSVSMVCFQIHGIGNCRVCWIDGKLQNISQLKAEVTQCITHFNLLIFKQLILFFRPPLACNFVEVGVAVSLPDSLLDVLLVVRAMLVKYDHFSDLCPSWVLNPLHEEKQKGVVPILPLRNQKNEDSILLYSLWQGIGKITWGDS